jgi:hypothetical protein
MIQFSSLQAINGSVAIQQNTGCVPRLLGETGLALPPRNDDIYDHLYKVITLLVQEIYGDEEGEAQASALKKARKNRAF